MTNDQIYYFRDLYSGHRLIRVRLFDNEFLFKTLTRKEYKYILSCFTSKGDKEDAICNVSCVYPENYDFSLCPFGGLVEYASELIEKESGFKDIFSIVEYYQQCKNVETMEYQCMDLIKAFIPEYTYEQMLDWTWHHLMEITVRAEKVASYVNPDKTYTLSNISDEEKSAYDSMHKDNPAFIKELYKNGIDPMKRFSSELVSNKPLLDFPLIGTQHWKNEEVLNLIRKQRK